MRVILLFLALTLAVTAQAKTVYVHPGQKKAPKAAAKQKKSKVKGRKAPRTRRRSN